MRDPDGQAAGGPSAGELADRLSGRDDCVVLPPLNVSEQVLATAPDIRVDAVAASVADTVSAA